MFGDRFCAISVTQHCSDYLVSGVPAPFVELVAPGIDVNPEQCIRWLDESEVPLATALRSQNLLL